MYKVVQYRSYVRKWTTFTVFHIDNFHYRQLQFRIKIWDSLGEKRRKTSPEQQRNRANAIQDDRIYVTVSCLATGSTPGVTFQVPGRGIFVTIFGTVPESIRLRT